MIKAEVEELRLKFQQAVRKTSAAFGEFAFRRWVPEKSAWRRQVLAAAYDAEIFAADAFAESDLLAKQPQLVRRLQALFSDTDFRKAVDAGTNTPTYFRERIQTVQTMITEVMTEK